MNIITITNEPKRGCGFRKEGGLYMIKPSRSWTWINPQALFEESHCCRLDLDCDKCPLHEPPERGGLIWIGEIFYPTVEAFEREANSQWISRRIQSVPHGFIIGEDWVLLAHRKAVESECPECSGKGWTNGDVELSECLHCGAEGKLHTPGIFHVFKPQRIEYIIKGDEPEEELERMEKRGITLVKLERTDLIDNTEEQ